MGIILIIILVVILLGGVQGWGGWGPSLPKELVRDTVPAAFREVAKEEFAGRVLHEVERLFPSK